MSSSNGGFKLGGVVPALLTPFKDDGTFNADGLRRHVEFLAERGVSGIYVCGTNGQSQNLTAEERMKVAEAAVDAAPSSLRLVVHAGANSVEESVRLARHAADIGAHAVAAVTPYYYHYDDLSLKHYYVSLARSVELPFFLYNIPQRTGNTISPKAVGEILAEAQSIVGIKDSSGDLGYLQEVLDAAPSGKLVFNGADHLFLPALALGVAGQVSGFANAYPELFVEIYEAWRAGELDRARRTQLLVVKLRRVLTAPYIEPLFEALRARGLDLGGHVKPPLRTLSEEERKTLHSTISKLGLEGHLKPLSSERASTVHG